MTWLLKRRLSRLGRRAAPDRAFKQTLHKTLSHAGYLPASGFQMFIFSWKRIGVALSLLTGLAVATASYAYTSPNVLPDHPLYGLRTAIEKVEVRVAPTPQAKERVQLKQLQRRVDEARLLAEKNKPIAAKHAETVLNQIEQAVDERPATSSDALLNDQRDFLRETVDLDKQELTEIKDEQANVQDPEDKQLVNQLLIDEADRMEEHVKSLQSVRLQERQDAQNASSASDANSQNDSLDD